LRHQQGDDADRDIDVKDPAPTVVVGEPAAHHRPEHRGDHDAQCPKGHGFAALGGRKDFKQDGLREWLQAAAGSALDHPEDDEEAKGWGESTRKRCQSEA